jgi:hypothetical protein
MASVKGSGSELAFFGHGKSGANVNIDLTTNGQGTQPAPIKGKLNIEVFTQTPGPVAPGYDGAVYVPDATLLSNNVVSNLGQQNVTEELLSGTYTVVDQTGHEAIQIVGSASGGDSFTVVGSAGDTIFASSIAGTQQEIDADNKHTIAGPETIFGGAGPTTVDAGIGDSIVGGSGNMSIDGGQNDTIIGGSGAITISGSSNDSIVPGSGGIISVHGHGHGYGDGDGDGDGGHDHDGGDAMTTVGGATVANANGGDYSAAAGTGAYTPADTVAGVTFMDPGHGASTVTGFDTATDSIQSATSVDANGTFLGTSAAKAQGTLVTFLDGSTLLLAGVTQVDQIHFIK